MPNDLSLSGLSSNPKLKDAPDRIDPTSANRARKRRRSTIRAVSKLRGGSEPNEDRGSISAQLEQSDCFYSARVFGHAPRNPSRWVVSHVQRCGRSLASNFGTRKRQFLDVFGWQIHRFTMKQNKEIPVKTADEAQLAEEQIVELSKRIEFYLTEYSVELLADKMRRGEFVVPNYQRAYTWEPERKSRFIESLVLGLPIPFLFFWEMPDGKLEIVDGSQRLRAIEEFVLGDLRLDELDSLTALSGFKFSELPESRRRKINNRSIRGIVLNEHADEQARFDMFERINTGSKIANKAEVRRGALAGPFMDLIMELGQSQEFSELAPVSKKQADEREREELVTRFFAYGDGLEGYRDRPSEFLFKYVKKMNALAVEQPALVGNYRMRFSKTMAFVKHAFPWGFRKADNGKATPRARFEALAIGSKLALDEHPALANAAAPQVVSWLTSKKFAEVTGSDGANAIARLRERIHYVRDRLLDK